MTVLPGRAGIVGRGVRKAVRKVIPAEPTTARQPRFEARTVDGTVEVRLPNAD